MYAPGHLGELTEIIDPELVDAVLEDAGVRQQRLRLLPARVVVYFVLALAFFERSSYQAVWAKLTAGMGSVPVARPCASSLARAWRRCSRRRKPVSGGGSRRSIRRSAGCREGLVACRHRQTSKALVPHTSNSLVQRGARLLGGCQEQPCFQAHGSVVGLEEAGR
ncbi:transposase domain-containing protein [Streptomyces sp. NPDC127084]|uniref:transposase domain-containing protein n=1 Tax=Streptomyces sp. NPDC127084 TaxID=3347133 RepID=UPI003666CF3D